MYVSIVTLENYPILLLEASIQDQDGVYSCNIIDGHCHSIELGAANNYISFTPYQSINILRVKYIGLKTKQVYEIQHEIKIDDTNKPFDSLIIGLNMPQVLLIWYKSKEKQVLVRDEAFYRQLGNLNSEIGLLNKITDNGMPEILKLLRQYSYRYMFDYGINNDKTDYPIITKMGEISLDGTCEIGNGVKERYQTKSLPMKIKIMLKKRKNTYSIYYWFDKVQIIALFERFYGAHPDTKTDFIFHIDVEDNKYELALYRYGLKEPQVISESVYQFIVFKNKFEYYRSEQYNQPKGAWIW